MSAELVSTLGLLLCLAPAVVHGVEVISPMLSRWVVNLVLPFCMRCTRTVARGGLRRAMVPGAVCQGCGAGGIVSQPTSASISAASSRARVAAQFFGASSR